MIQKSTKFIAASGTIFLIVSICVFILFFNMVSAQKAEFVAESIAQVQAENHYQALSSLMRTLEESKGDRERLYGSILKEADVIAFLTLIESIGKEQGVILKTDSLDEEPISPDFETLVMNLQVSGTYEKVMRMLTILENIPYQSSVTNVRIMREEKEGTDLWTSRFSVRVTKSTKP